MKSELLTDIFIISEEIYVNNILTFAQCWQTNRNLYKTLNYPEVWHKKDVLRLCVQTPSPLPAFPYFCCFLHISGHQPLGSECVDHTRAKNSPGVEYSCTPSHYSPQRPHRVNKINEMLFVSLNHYLLTIQHLFFQFLSSVECSVDSQVSLQTFCLTRV